jgi:hypothetical protein
MNRITKLWKDNRWMYWLRIFLALCFTALMLHIVFWISTVERKNSELTIELRDMKRQVEAHQYMIDIMSGVKDADGN